MKDVVIRKANALDIDTILNYELIVFGECISRETMLEHMRESSLFHYFVIEVKETNRFVGHIDLWIDQHLAQINHLYVIEAFQGRKIGKKAMRFLWNLFKEKRISEVTLEVRTSNKRAIALYEQFGFRQVSVRKNYYKNGEDALFMHVRIGSD